MHAAINFISYSASSSHRCIKITIGLHVRILYIIIKCLFHPEKAIITYQMLATVSTL